MKVTYNWLKEYVDFDWSVEELGERITMLGVEEDIGVVLHGKRTNIVLPIIMEHSHMLIQQEQL